MPKTRKRNGRYCKQKGNAFECKIAKELRELGYTGVVTARSESKRMDDNKVDLIDTENKLGCYIQTKATQSTPSYFKIRKECPLKDKPFVVFWAKQVAKEKNICTEGEVVMIPKDYFYHLLEIELKNEKV